MKRNSNNQLIIGIIIVVVLLVVVVGVIVLLNKSKQTGTSAGPGQTVLPAGEVAKPAPIAKTFHGCPPPGDGGDPVLNTLKNRVDETAWQPSTVAAILSYTWPKAIEYQPRSRWSKSDAAAIARYEGAPVQVEGYLVDAKKMGPESCNCHSVDDVDFHIWLVDNPTKSRAESVVIEASPRVRAVHSAWSLANIRSLATKRVKVRISGWIMMDPEHPDQIGKTRGTIWEIHPVMQIETQSGGSWKPLDSGTTGVSSAAAVVATLEPFTPENTASPPPVSSANQQRNQDVQITKVVSNGRKGTAEPDEYVQLTNNGSQPVDITDWVLQDEAGANAYKWESYVMQPGTSIRVYTNEVHPDTGGFSFGVPNQVWDNAGDVVVLFDADKALVSRFAYGNRK